MTLDSIPIYLAYVGRYGSLRFVRADGLGETTGHLSMLVKGATLQRASEVFTEVFRLDLMASLRGLG